MKMDQNVKKLRWSQAALLILFFAAGFSSCEKINVLPVPFNVNTTWHFQADIQPIFTAKCISCHNGSQVPDLRDGKSYNALIKTFINKPDDAANSSLYIQITQMGTHIPKTTDNEKLMILYWIKQGALNN
jgi:hypothetical protein